MELKERVGIGDHGAEEWEQRRSDGAAMVDDVAGGEPRSSCVY